MQSNAVQINSAEYIQKLQRLKNTAKIVGTERLGFIKLHTYVVSLMEDYVERSANDVRRALGYDESFSQKFSTMLSQMATGRRWLTRRSVLRDHCRQYLYTLRPELIEKPEETKSGQFTIRPRKTVLVSTNKPNPVIPAFTVPDLSGEILEMTQCITIKGQAIEMDEAVRIHRTLVVMGFTNPSYIPKHQQGGLVKKAFRIGSLVLDDVELKAVALELDELL